MVGGSGPAVLLLHGYPQSHLMWHAARRCSPRPSRCVAADLAGYGASFRPTAAPDHMPHSKRAMAADQVEAMAVLGFDRFAVAGHDRGGRVGVPHGIRPSGEGRAAGRARHRPTGEVWRRADREFAGYWHWAFLAQPAPLPESLIGADPQAYFDLHVGAGMGLGRDPDRYPPAVMEAYRRALRRSRRGRRHVRGLPRRGATVDLKFDDADRAAGNTDRLCGPRALGRHGGLPHVYPDVLEVWRRWAPDVRGQALDATHFLRRGPPEEVATELRAFLRRAVAARPHRRLGSRLERAGRADDTAAPHAVPGPARVRDGARIVSETCGSWCWVRGSAGWS